WCIRFTPVATPDHSQGVLLDASGCAHIWGGEEAYLHDISRRLTARGYCLRLSIADTIGAAWGLSRFGAEINHVPEEKQLEALVSLPLAALRLNEETMTLTHKLGLRQVGQLVGMNASSLRRR